MRPLRITVSNLWRDFDNNILWILWAYVPFLKWRVKTLLHDFFLRKSLDIGSYSSTKISSWDFFRCLINHKVIVFDLVIPRTRSCMWYLFIAQYWITYSFGTRWLYTTTKIRIPSSQVCFQHLCVFFVFACFLNNLIYVFMAVLGLHCCVGFL